MDPLRPNHVIDPEFETSIRDFEQLDLGPCPELYLRVIANPFPAFLFLLTWGVVLFKAAATWFAGPLTPMLLVIMLASLALIPQLIQFHCLDCGKTGNYPRWVKHACPKSFRRREANRPRRLRGPTPLFQVLIWLWVIAGSVIAIHNGFVRIF